MTHFPQNLIDGYHNFISKSYSEHKERYKKLSVQGQRPKTLIIACCDSRAAPETVFDAGPGELFVVRNVANLVPPSHPDGEYHGTSAALEFAIQALKVENIVVMGHARCGGIAAALDDNFEPLSSSDFIGKWMSLVAPAREKIAHQKENLTDFELQRAMERMSIRVQIENLRTFKCVDTLEKAGRLRLHGAWFDIETGELWVLNSDTGAFELL
jgi:carbonic anhydrase